MQIREILQDRTGSNFSLGHRWSVEVGAHNKSKYAILAGEEEKMLQMSE